jgi:anaerobic selenocysteine-containing dehydrogenase
MTETMLKQKPSSCNLSRRNFLKISATVGGAALVGSLPYVHDVLAATQSSDGYPLSEPENILYSVCLNCHNACPLKAKIQDGVLVKIDGNPYSPQNMLVPLPESTPLKVSAKSDGAICPKGQVGVQVVYDPYRLRRVIKRTGKRGASKWETIDFNQAIDEIVNGGNLFGEGDVPGLKDIYKLTDNELAVELKGDAVAVAAGDMTLAEFQDKHADHLDMLVDPEHPDLGPANNQFVFMGGRIEHGRKELSKRFTYDGFGSTNFFLHTTICEQSHHIAYKQMSGKTHMKPDIMNSEFIIYFGTSPFEANFGPTNLVPKLTTSMVENGLKIAVVDPRLSKTAAKAWKWLAPKTGTDGAIALGMIRWIVENERYDAAYLAAPNIDTANANDETSFSNATFLVRQDDLVFLSPEDAGLELPVDDNGDPISSKVVMVEGTPTLSVDAEEADIFVDGEVNGIPVKSSMQMLKERAFERSVQEYADIAGIRSNDITALAKEFTSHGKKAIADFYRGPVQHTNGYYNGQAIITLNVLIGNVDWQGGLTTGGSHWHEDGSKGGAPFPKNIIISAPNGLPHWGVYSNRERATYEKSTLFDGYPAKRPWYPFTNELYQNIIPSAADGYPYPIKALFINKGTPVLASPAGHAQIEMLRDPKIIPLMVACDVVVGETSMYADYIFPDTTFLERWGIPHASPDIVTKMSKVRQPLIAPLTETVTVDGEEMPLGLEAFMIAVGKKLGLPGFGKDGLGEGYDLNRPEQYFLAMAANLAFGDKEDGSETLPPTSDEEMAIFKNAHSHLPPSVYDEAVWKAAVPDDLWPSVVTLINHGGRFEDAGKAYKGDKMAHQWKGRWNLYVEKVAKGKHSLTGKNFDGLPKVEPVLDAAGKEVNDPGYDLTLITYKEVTGGQSRTHGAHWMTAILPENFIALNSIDAARMGLETGDKARLISPTLDKAFDLGDGRSHDTVGRVKVIEGIRPGVAAVSWSYGHWAYGSNDVEIDGLTIAGDQLRSSGLVPNPAMRLDPVLGDVCLTDPIGGSASFYDTRIRLEKV